MCDKPFENPAFVDCFAVHASGALIKALAGQGSTRMIFLLSETEGHHRGMLASAVYFLKPSADGHYIEVAAVGLNDSVCLVTAGRKWGACTVDRYSSGQNSLLTPDVVWELSKGILYLITTPGRDRRAPFWT